MPFFRKGLPLLFLLMSVLTVAAQVKEGNTYLEKKDYEAAFEAFEAENKKPHTIAEATFRMAQIMATPEAPQYHLDSAYHYVQRARKKYLQLSNGKRKKLDKAGAGRRDMSKLRNDIADSALAQIIRNPSVKAYEKFFNTFERMSRRTEEEALDSMVVTLKKVFAREKDYERLANLFDRYGDEIRKRDFEGYNVVEKNLFTAFVQENGWKQLDVFEKRFHRSMFSMDQSKEDFKKIRTSGNPENYRRFIKYYPRSPYLPLAEDSLAMIQNRRLAQQQSSKQLLNIIQNSNDSKELAAADQALYPRFEEIMTVEELEAAIPREKVPYLPRLMSVIYQSYRIQGTKQSLLMFKKKYPNYPKMSQVDNDIAQLTIVEQQNLAKMQEYDEMIRAFAPSYEAFMALQALARPDIKDKNWEAAIEKAEEYRPFFKADSAMVDSFIAILAAPDPNIDIVKLGNPTINSSKSEYSPVLSADGQTLYFCRRTNLNNLEAIHAADYVSEKQWTDAAIIPELNAQRANLAPLAISTDGTRMIIYRNSKIAFTDKTKEGWSKVSNYSSNINSSNWQGAATLSSNGRVMIFEARYREDAVKSRDPETIDLYIAQKQKDGSWGQSVNLGSVINTAFDERSPFLHPDMRTLYFSSEGHGGLGGLDVFKTTRLDDSWTKWSEPQHLGKGINTASNDWGYKLSTDGKTAYYSAAPLGQSDIYQVNVPEELRPELVSTLTLYVVDDAGKAIEADVILENTADGATIGELRTDPTNGRAFAVLPNEGRYGYVITKEGYFPVSNNVDLEEIGLQLEVTDTIRLIPIKEIIESQTKIELKNLFFDFDEFTLQQGSFPELNRLASIIQQNKVRIKVLGHTDNKGTQAYNKKLSEKRARAVKAYLINLGISEELIDTKGLGETQPIASNDTPKGQAQNRRVEIQLLKMNKK